MRRRARGIWHRPDAVTAVAGVVLLVGAVQLFAGAADAGVTTDEPAQVERTVSWLDHGYFLPESVMTEGRPDPANEFSSPYVYGPATSAIAHFANAAIGNEPLDGVSHSAGAYEVRHLIVAVLALITAVATGAAVSLLTRSRRFGLWAAAGLLAVPCWMGQGFFNIKDVPAGAGYTLVTVGLLFALFDKPDRPAGLFPRLAIGVVLAAGVCIGAGTRLSLWVPILASLLAYGALRLGQRRFGGIVHSRGADFAVAAGVVAGVGAIAALYPEAAVRPFSLLTESVSSSAAFPYEGYTLTAGRLLTQHPPWWYLPVWVGASYPVLLAALAVLGTVAGLRALLGNRGAPGLRAIWGRRELGLPLVLLQALLLPVAAIVDGAVMYGGIRQHLYIVPAIGILAGVGAARLSRWADSARKASARRVLVAAALCAALAIPMAEQTLLFPYNYAYVNPLAGIGGVNDRWETDFWFASAPEAIARVPRGVELRCSEFLLPAWEPEGNPGPHPCDGDQFEPFEDRRSADIVVPRQAGEPAVWLIARKRGGNHPPPYCEQAGDITRWLRGEDVVMSYVLRCDPRRIHQAEEG